ncbi:MAG: 7-cyano-7-deazaguanine reductase [Deltaproteobacteria bacterium RBG_13_49_15]|nr:MAG: 7-cyano-7-deazaguanine reductase [Deltaproteobacteria bacterium RBG_13_49_15]
MGSKSKNLNYRILGPDTVKTDLLEVIEYLYLGRDIEITIEHLEYTSVCPMTGLPDFGKITVRYVPSKKLIELKSLKFYLLQYRNVGIFYEHLVNRIMDDLVHILGPKKMEIIGEFTSRGGLTTRVSVSYEG